MGRVHNQLKRSRRSIRYAHRYLRRRPFATALLTITITLFVVLILAKQPNQTIVDHGAYTPLLAVISRGESNGNYNAYFGNADNTAIRFTEMPISDVLRWQDDYVRQGHPSNAVGKYQFLRPTLAGLVRQLKINPQTVFDAPLQDRLAIALVERRGSVAYIDKKLTREQFAANLAKEWAALPKVIGDRPGDSYYAGDGLNQSKISVDEIMAAIGTFEQGAIR